MTPNTPPPGVGPGGMTPNSPPPAAQPEVPPAPREPLTSRLERFAAANPLETIVVLILSAWAVVFLALWLVL
jgi:hypothetical protein